MQETRVNKFKEYRQSLGKKINDTVPNNSNQEKPKTADDILNSPRIDTSSSSTLSFSYDDIMKASHQNEQKSIDDEENQERKRKIIKYVLYGLALFGILAIIVTLIVVLCI